MSDKIKVLYEHNQKAYDAAVEKLKTTNRTCIIHPTGTGKSLIIAEFINKNPDSKHLLLAPSNHIKDEIAKHTGVDFTFATYHGLLGSNSSKIVSNKNFDFIYLDEFHRIGADQWGKKTIELIDQNVEAKIIGTSATHIRYLDDQRNMATELFGDNIASHITLAQAISEGILKTPTFVTALYSLAEESKSLIRKIKESDHSDKKGLIDKLESSIIDWENSGGIDSIIKKHLPRERNRIIVFCKDRTHMHQAKDLLIPSFNNICNDVETIEVYSDFGLKQNKLALQNFEADSTTTKILFTIDKLNEGLHVEGANTVILMRGTVSPIIYFQQIGRGFSVGQSQNPLIFDFVNNFASIRINELKSEFQSHVDFVHKTRNLESITDTISINFIDKVKDWKDVFQEIEISIDNWEVNLSKLKTFIFENGRFPALKEGKIGRWVSTQRQAFKKGTLLDDKIKLLEEIGIVWDLLDSQFLEALEELKTFVVKNNRFPLPEEGKLGSWVSKRRQKYKKGKLSEDKIKLLEEIGITWDLFDSKFLESFEELKNFVSENGMFPVRRDGKLGRWVNSRRYEYKRKKLSEDKIKLLEEIGFDFKAKE
ncbi:Helicase associated domain protein [Dyadobacter sp. CY312]|uniref:Helicase associated domain protein n=1 Tax=Dyadobacter sp. CY312 TaxID=2907303 RepID=UPI001F1E4C18|nr:Helicase associated domain protein [Dyadobacter sp. CY312]MCE7039176.1 Helicase associated domain protein [Dyadobacter sp. CY312]